MGFRAGTAAKYPCFAAPFPPPASGREHLPESNSRCRPPASPCICDFANPCSRGRKYLTHLRGTPCRPAGSSPTPSVPSAWMPCRRPIPDTPACRWAWPTSPRCCGPTTCGTTRAIPRGPTATGSCCRTATARCCSTRCCTSRAIRSRWSSSGTSASSARTRPGTPRSTRTSASRPPPARSARASPTRWAWRSPRRSWPRPSTARATR